MALACCGKCLSIPCPMPIAISVNVTAGGVPGPVKGAFIRVNFGDAYGCAIGVTASICSVPGYGGAYDLEVGAPGFQTTHRTVTVHGTSRDCGCDTVTPEYLTIVLVPNPSIGGITDRQELMRPLNSPCEPRDRRESSPLFTGRLSPLYS